MDDSALVIETLPEIGAIAPAEWDALVPDNHPFLRHAFLKSLEDAGCVGGETGWQPCHVRLASAGLTLAAAPLYLKTHSQGEYVFDHGWANAYQQAGGAYYPKLQLCVPFSPVPGPRLLCGGNADHRAVLIEGLKRITGRMGVSGLHVTFCQEDDWQALADAGFLKRIDHQFHWTNEGYRTFDAFLAALSASRRKTIRRERRDAMAGGLEVDILCGPDITEAHWDAMYAFYMDTGSRKWGRPYLNREFFSLLGAHMAEQVVLMLARDGGQYVAGALHLKSDDTLYGRYWGCARDIPFLHFELCYYRAIDYAIAHGLHRVEAGAQGGHKLARGYLPNETMSAHWIADPGFRAAVADYLERERHYVREDGTDLGSHGPFRKG
jgi:predicted N-acyltransferase